MAEEVKKKRHRRTKAEMQAAREAEALAKAQQQQPEPQPEPQPQQPKQDIKPPSDLLNKERMLCAMICHCMFYCSYTSSDRCRPAIKDGTATFVLDCGCTNCSLYPYTNGAYYTLDIKKFREDSK